ncbi:hypothetical protein MCOR02_003884 [Pyricularia oryzae]|nr:hypothetical protein MCOR02_003884 [Pyricularia oryzae]KAI6326607.1 hypothetical protein MCOR34_000700 [Pyricularia oryzae]KAI6455569.1 hypothetical protein MCOR17_008619 [Pyricularia oryzae]KAI6500108.1 hypothetical protein MCOR13_006056 [Pyricularia oryzae]KAI6584689.1 hypothetical protein MCOR04_004869 [Pyricularia oryzae]
MDPSFIFGALPVGTLPRPQTAQSTQYFHPQHPQHPQRPPLSAAATRVRQQHRDDDGDGSSNRIAHTLTACCRCRQRKTRCDPTLPRCLPCERSGSICEYFDTTKGKKINRNYVVRLQTRVRHLESELAQFTDDDEFPRNTEDMVRPGGLVKLDEHDETPRYLGPSSGIAMTRLVMEDAKRFTEAKKISDVIPSVGSRRMDRSNRMQSIVSYGGSISGPSIRKKSYPMISAHAARELPSRPMANKLLEVYIQRGQVFLPTLHEVVLAKDLEEVYNGDKDPHKNFIVWMVLAISLQKLELQYAGLADGFYLAAMQYFEEVVRTKDLRTLQCLVLIGQYSTLTPTRSAVYYIVGLATRICQQLGMGEEKTIKREYDLGLIDMVTLDLKRRLSWIILSMEFGLAHSMGRPNGFAKGDDFMDVDFFDSRPDELITADGIKEGPPSEKKLMAIHFLKMRLLQAEIRRKLYEKKRPEPRDERHPWFAQMLQKLQDWRDSSPKQPAWCGPWFTGKYHSMVVGLYRPSPQVPKPSSAAALRCFESSAHIIELSSQQLKQSAVDITWIFLLTIYMSLNTLLWSVSYPEVRKVHSREQLEELVQTCLDTVDQCSERWPGTATASQNYANLARACMHSYDQADEQPAPPVFSNSFATPPSLTDTSSPSASDTSAHTAASTTSAQPHHHHQQPHGQPLFNNSQLFGYSFDQPQQQQNQQQQQQPEPTFKFENTFDDGFPPPRHPQFRTGSIFFNPASESGGGGGRRPSYFPPDFVQDEGPGPNQIDDPTPPASTTPHASNLSSPRNNIPTPPESLGNGSHAQSNNALSPAINFTDTGSVHHTPVMGHQSPPMPHETGAMTPGAPAIKFTPQTPQTPQGHPTPQGTPQRPIFAVPALPPHAQQNQRHHQQVHQHDQQHQHQPPQWFNQPPPPMPQYAAYSQNNAAVFSNGTHNFGDPGSAAAMLGAMPPAGFGGPHMNHGPPDGMGNFGGFPMDPMRQGSLTHEQLSELMGVLEQDGMTEINQLLGIGPSGNGGGGGGAPDEVRW